MTKTASQELYHEIFGSVLDRTEMTPYLLLPAADFSHALKQVTKMMRNRGFDTIGRASSLQVRNAAHCAMSSRHTAIFLTGCFLLQNSSSKDWPS